MSTRKAGGYAGSNRLGYAGASTRRLGFLDLLRGNGGVVLALEKREIRRESKDPVAPAPCRLSHEAKLLKLLHELACSREGNLELAGDQVDVYKRPPVEEVKETEAIRR